MLLTETIKNSTSAIKKRRATIESKQHAETYARALAQLSQSTGSIKDTLDCANAIKESGIVEFLSGGCSKEPVELLRDMGVDMRTSAPVNDALSLFGELIDELSALLG